MSATARDYLQSILTTLATLQNHSDEELDRARDELRAMDEALNEVVYVIDPEG